MTDWDRRYIELAHKVASWSRDPSTKCGAFISRPDRTPVSFGYNGFPRGVDDSPDRYADRDFKYAAIVHAEMNAVLNAREGLQGCLMHVTWHPCARCAAVIVQSGIKSVVFDGRQPIPERWRVDMAIAAQILREGGVRLEQFSPGDHD